MTDSNGFWMGAPVIIDDTVYALVCRTKGRAATVYVEDDGYLNVELDRLRRIPQHTYSIAQDLGWPPFAHIAHIGEWDDPPAPPGQALH